MAKGLFSTLQKRLSKGFDSPIPLCFSRSSFLPRIHPCKPNSARVCASPVPLNAILSSFLNPFSGIGFPFRLVQQPFSGSYCQIKISIGLYKQRVYAKAISPATRSLNGFDMGFLLAALHGFTHATPIDAVFQEAKERLVRPCKWESGQPSCDWAQ